jgi:tetratricopeptide (TPR) repeat protein
MHVYWGKILLRVGLWTAVLSGAAFLAQAASSPALDKAEELYQKTKFEASLASLDKQPADSATQFLAARDYFMLGEFKKSVELLQKALGSEPNNSEYADWLGRAYGKRAETANPLLAPGLASKARQAFERAVELNGTNRDALSDLFDYYLNAPGFLGGGYDKAVAVANKMAKIDPSEAYFAKAQLAQKHQEYEAAEQHLRQAVAVGPHEVGHLIALAKFLANQGRTRESDAVFEEAQKVSPNAPRVWFAKADVLIKEKRNLSEAKMLLEQYVQAPITPDDPPREQAFRLLKQAEAGGA